MTYNKSFEQHIQHINSWINTPVEKRAIVYTGDFENTSGEINLINYRHLDKVISAE